MTIWSHSLYNAKTVLFLLEHFLNAKLITDVECCITLHKNYIFGNFTVEIQVIHHVMLLMLDYGVFNMSISADSSEIARRYNNIRCTAA